jgi:hypothetical protein
VISDLTNSTEYDKEALEGMSDDRLISLIEESGPIKSALIGDDAVDADFSSPDTSWFDIIDTLLSLTANSSGPEGSPQYGRAYADYLEEVYDDIQDVHPPLAAKLALRSNKLLDQAGLEIRWEDVGR